MTLSISGLIKQTFVNVIIVERKLGVMAIKLPSVFEPEGIGFPILSQLRSFPLRSGSSPAGAVFFDNYTDVRRYSKRYFLHEELLFCQILFSPKNHSNPSCFQLDFLF